MTFEAFVTTCFLHITCATNNSHSLLARNNRVVRKQMPPPFLHFLKYLGRLTPTGKKCKQTRHCNQSKWKCISSYA